MDIDHEDMVPELTLVVGADQKALEDIERELAEMEEMDDEIGALKGKLIRHDKFPQLAAALGWKGRALANKLKAQQANTRKRQGLLRVLARRNGARRKVCKAYEIPKRAPVTAADLRGRVKTPAPLFAVLRFADGPLQDSIRSMGGPSSRTVKVFHKGIDDQGSSYGFDNPLDRHATNLLTGGALPDGNTFIGYRIECDIERVDGAEIDIADLRLLGKARLRYGDRNGSNMVDLAMLRECPPQTGLVEAVGNGGAALGLRFTGEPFRSDTPLFTIKGGEKGHEMQLEFPDASAELSQRIDVRIRLHGKHYQLASGS